MTLASVLRRYVRFLPAVVWLAGMLAPAAAQAQDRPARFLTREEIVLYGIGLKVEPAHQTVPKDIATIVSPYLQTPNLPESVPPFAPDAVVKGTLRGPGFATPVELTVAPNTPFNIPPLTVPGTYTLENIRLISGGEVLLRGTPEQATIEVIERLLVTQVTARPLTAAEIREKGIVFDQSNFQAYNFSAAFAIQDRTVNLNFPVLLPALQGAGDVSVGGVTLPGVSAPSLPQLKTLIPDTLKLQTQVPNLSVVGFTLKAPTLQGNNFVVPPIPGVIVIPGDIGFLNQYFSVLLMVGNVAPAGSGLEVSGLSAEIVLPPGRDGTVNTSDDPLRMAQTTQGTAPRTKLVVQPGPDGKLGTSDDVGILKPGDSGNAEYLVEGVKEGSHVVEMEITGTLHGLPVGPVQIRGRAAGSVLVRNPNFTLTFTHPEAVAAGEAYTLDVTVTNTSESPANFVSLTLYPRNVSGATVIGDPSREIESVLPGDSATVSFDLVSRITGKVTAATLDSNEKVAGRFELKAAVGELGVPVSPDTLVLPKEAGSLPGSLREAALGLLGKAYAVATAPSAALPTDVRRFSRKVVMDRSVEVAEAGFRHTLKEPLADSAAQLLMDFMGSNYTRLPQLVAPADLTFEQDNFTGFDDLRRRSVRGDTFAAAVAKLLAPSLTTNGAATFHRSLAEKWSYRPGHVSVLVSSSGPLPVSLALVDAGARRVGGRGTDGKIIKEIPFSDFLWFDDTAGNHVGEMAILAAPQTGTYTIRLTRQPASAGPFTVSVMMPLADGSLRQTTFTVSQGQVPAALPGTPLGFTFELVDPATPAPVPVNAASVETVDDPAPSVISVIQQVEADQIRCEADKPGYPVGRVIAVLFSEEVSPASVFDRMKAEDILGFLPEENRVVGVALQPGRRIAFVALRDPVGPFVPRTIGITSAVDLRGNQMVPFTGPIEMKVGTGGGVVTGRVVRADGSVVPFANVRLFYRIECNAEPTWIGIASKSANAQGAFSWDYVLRALPDRIVAIDPETEEFRSVPFNIQRDGQHLNVDIVFLGRGTFSGTTRAESGLVLADTAIRVTSLTDGSQYGARTDANGRFTIARIPVGSIFVEAINTTAKAKFTLSELIPFAGATIERDITLLDIEQQQTTLKHGTVKGHVLRTDGTTPAGGVPVFVWYTHLSQPGVRCPGDPAPVECAVAGAFATSSGAFSFADVPAGTLRVSAFDQDGLVQGEARLLLAEDATVDVNVLLVGGLGTVRGKVQLPDGSGVAGAKVGGGLSLVTTNGNGEFTLTDVPVGRREIVAVSELLRTTGRVSVDLTRAGETIFATIVLDAVGSVSGRVVQHDGKTPVAGGSVYVFKPSDGGYEIVGSATTDSNGGYRIDGIREGEYSVSSFNTGFTDGNIVPAVLKFHGQVFRADIRWRGGNGKVTGRVLDANGTTPLRAMVSLSGDQVLVAGGQVGVAFRHVNHFKIAETDLAEGKFTLTGAWVGPVTVSAAGQFSPDPISIETQIPAPNATVDVELKLQPTSEIRGVVLQPNGVNPVGADVIVKYKSEAYKLICTTSGVTGEETCDSIPQGIQEEIVVTDEHGRFWLPIVNAGPFTLSVEDPSTGKVGQIKGAVRAGEDAEVSVRLLGVGELSVQVMSSDRETKIPGANVVVTQLNHPRKRVEGRADTDGRIVFLGADGFTEGEFAIEATDLRNGFAGRGTARITKDEEEVAVTVYLFDVVGTVSGKVFAPNGVTPVPNAEIVLTNNAGPLAFALTDVDGSFSIQTVPLGNFRLESFEARTGRRAAASGRVDLAGQDVTVNLTQAALGAVKGQVLDSGTFAPLKGWTVTLAQRSISGLSLGSLQATSGIDGAYIFPGSAQGTFTLTARKSEVNGSASASGTIEREGETVDVPLLVKINRPLTGTISGVVLTATGDPAPDRPVEICYEGRSCAAPIELTADSEGRFSLADVPLGRFLVTARSQVTRESGATQGELAFDGDIASVRVVLAGLGEVKGVVVRPNGDTVEGARVTLSGLPTAGCQGNECVKFADEQGRFSFVDVPARTFTVSAEDPLNPALRGSTGGGLLPSEVKDVRVVLSPAFAVSGRILLPGGVPAVRMIAELTLATVPEQKIYTESGADGTFTFGAVPPGTHQLLVTDPIGSGKTNRSLTVAADVSLGDLTLDTEVPSVASSNPAHAATGVLETMAVRITFSEPIRPGTVTADSVSLTGPSGAVDATLDVTDNDTVVTLKPLAPLALQTRYTLRVSNIEDRFARPMAADYVATFTTIDRTPPTVAETSPAASGGAPVSSVIRIRFSESLDVSKFSPQPIVVTGPNGPLAGEKAYLLGNTVVVFTPKFPLAEDTTYTVTLERAWDLAGNPQAQALTYQFTTTDRTAPQISKLTAANDGKVIENGLTSVAATLGGANDVAVVDWYLNDVLVAADRTSPFELSFQAVPAIYGPAGSTIRVSAIATDTSGNRGDATSTEITVTPDVSPVVTILAPANGLSAKTGDHVAVRIRATDDLGITQIGYRATTGDPAHALTRPVTPASTDRTEDFAFVVPANAAPGSTIVVHASASDTKGQVSQTSIAIVVQDAAPPAVEITGATTGARVLPGQQTTVIVRAQDPGGVASVTFTASGIVTASEPRTIAPPQPSIVTSFSVTIPTTAQAGQTLTLGATAKDAAGNSATATQLVLTIADTEPPTIALEPENSGVDAVPGRSVNVVATANDAIGITRIDLTASGGATFSGSQQVSPPLGSATRVFAIPVPESAAPGSQINVVATATDISGNTSAAAVLTLNVVAGAQVSLPASTIVDAGKTVDVQVGISEDAPAGGVRVDFTSDVNTIATATPFVVIAEGTRTATVTISGVSGGTTQIRALVGGFPRASMSVTVRGGIVDGVVRDIQFNAVPGAQLTISGGGAAQNVTADEHGRFSVDGVAGPDVSVRALDPITRLYGHTDRTMDHTNGHVSVTVILIPAGAIHGTVFDADGQPVGEGVRVDIGDIDGGAPLGTTFTGENGQYEFPLVTLGEYRVDATAQDGRRGRSTILLTESGEDVLVDVTYLGTGTVSGTVLRSGAPVANAVVKFRSWSIFGTAPDIEVNADGNGKFSFANVPLGNFAVTATDESTGQGGSVSGRVDHHEQPVTANVTLTAFGAIEGYVYRADTTTPVAGATVKLGTLRQTTTTPEGYYRFDIVPLATYTVEAEETSTRGYAKSTATVVAQGATAQANLIFLPQGRVRVFVNDPGGATVEGAFVTVSATLSGKTDHRSGRTGEEGFVVIDRVLAGAFTVTASYGVQSGQVKGTLAEGELLDVFVELSPTGSLEGVIYEPNGQPAAGARVSIVDANVSTVTNDQGEYRITGRALGRYDLVVYDTANRLRARTSKTDPSDDLVISTNGERAERDFTFIGLATVSGVVTRPDSFPAQKMSVQIWYGEPGFEGSKGTSTDAGGNYTFENIPAGPVRVVASDTQEQLYGERTGAVEAHNVPVGLNIALTSNAITLPATRYDANGFAHDVQRAGSLLHGGSSLFSGNGTERGAMVLDITSAGSTVRFSGPEVPTVEDGGREITVRQEDLASLSVTRKVFVPRDGYFARYLEIFRNGGNAPVTIDVDLTSHPSGFGTTMHATSSGDTSFTAADDWFVTTRDGGISAAFVMQGADTTTRTAATGFELRADGFLRWSRATYGWRSITIDPGQTIALMHFAVQQWSPAAALASAQRLGQLPPEALAGLSADEVAAVRNFEMPEGGVSVLAPLPVITGKVTGTVFEHNGTTIAPNATVRFTSDLPYFSRAISVQANAEGVFSLTGVLDDNGSTVAIPATGFSLQSNHPLTLAASPIVPGTFESPSLPAVVDIAFTNTGMITGTVKRHNNAVVPTANATLTGGPLTSSVFRQVQDASFLFTGIPAGSYQLRILLPHAQGSALEVIQTVEVQAGVEHTVPMTFGPTGTISGTITTSRQQPANNVTVTVKQGNFSRSVSTGSGGGYSLPDIPEGPVTVTAIQPVTDREVTVPATVVRDVDTDVDIELTPVGSVLAHVTLQNAQPAVGASVSVQFTNRFGQTSRTGTVGTNGTVLIDGIPAGAFTLRAWHPATASVFGVTTGEVTADTPPVDAFIELAAAGTVTVTVKRGNDAIAGSEVALIQGGVTQQTRTSGSNGQVVFTGVSGAYTVRAKHPANTSLTVTAPGSITTEGQSDTPVLVLPAIGTVTGHVRLGSAGVVGVVVSLRSSSGAVNTLTATTVENGRYTIGGVPAGAFTVTVEDTVRRVFGTAGGQIAVDLETVTVDIALVDNTVSLPRELFDGNDHRWDIQRYAGISDGSSDAYDGGLRLRLRQGASSVLFNGSAQGVAEAAGREIAVREAGILGLDVTRKVFVPQDGYFARYLEVLTNPGPNRITVDVSVETELGSDGSTVGVATSSGDTEFGPEDFWVVTDDADLSGDPSLVHVIGGAGARAVDAASRFNQQFLEYRWNSISIDPGQSVILMHFATQHFSRAQAQAVGERLVQLPPEALESLTPEEIAAIINFAVPPDGSSPLPEERKPALGTVTGRTVGVDGTTPVPNTELHVRSGNVLFGRTRSGQSGVDGTFTLSGVLVGDYTITATAHYANVQSPPAAGRFTDGELSTITDVVFSNAALVKGKVRTANGAVFPMNGMLTSPYTREFSAGEYVLPVVVPGPVTVQGTVNHPQGSALFVTAEGNAPAGVTTTIDLALPPVGAVTGIVSTAGGRPAAGVTVILGNSSWLRQTATDDEGRYALTEVPTGFYTIAAYHPVTNMPLIEGMIVEAGLPTTKNLTLYGVATLKGKITNPDGSPAVQTLVTLSEDRYVGLSTTTDDQGDYLFENIPSVALRLRAFAPGFTSRVFRLVDVPAVADGQTETVNVTVPAVATLRVHAQDPTGAPLVGRSIRYMSPYDFSETTAGATNQDGYLDIRSPEGFYQVSTTLSGIQVRRQGTVEPADHGRIIDIVLRDRVDGRVQGTIYAGDGTTRIPWVFVEILDGEMQALYATSNESGDYDTGVVKLPSVPFTVRAWVDTVTLSATASVAADGPTIRRDFIAPLGVIKGTVRYHHGDPVPWPDIFATTLVDGEERTYYPIVSAETGVFMFVVPPGTYELHASSESGLTSRTTVTVATAASVVTVDPTMPPTGTVTGRVRDAQGDVLGGHYVALWSPNLQGMLSSEADSAGRFTITGVPLGPFSVEVCGSSPIVNCETAFGELVSVDQPAQANITLAQLGSLRVVVRDTQGNVPESYEIYVHGMSRYFEVSPELNPAHFATVPEGTVLVSVVGNGEEAVAAEATIIAGRETLLELEIGAGVRLSNVLIGTDEFIYDVGCQGTISDGGHLNEPWGDAFDTTGRLSVNGANYPCRFVARTDEAGRQFVIGPAQPGSDQPWDYKPPVHVTRKLFSPVGGGFIRYYDEITNTSPVAQTFALRIDGNYGPSGSGTTLAVAPSSTGNTYAVFTATSSDTTPAIGLVFAGAGAPNAPVLQFRDQVDPYGYAWNVTLQPGQSAAILHYAIQRAPGDAAGVQAQAAALASLSDPAALQGLTSVERARIVNFAGLSGSATLRVSVEGTITAEDGETPLEDAVVYVLDASNDRLLATMTTTQPGTFAFQNLYVTSAGVKVVATYGPDPLHTATAIVPVSTDGQTVTGVKLTIPVTPGLADLLRVWAFQ